MGQDSKIEWTDHTFNPWWGCVKVSEGCKNCYAEKFDKRLAGNTFVTHWGPDAPRRFFGNKHWDEPLKWNAKAEKEGKRARVFCASMADVFEDRRDLDIPREKLWNLIDSTPNLDWLILTKRPDKIMRLSQPIWWDNIWIGTSVENMERACERIPYLLEIPSKIRFLSVEPMLGKIDLWLNKIDWVIVGGESGRGSRPFDWDWARSIRDQCKAAGVPFFMKQGPNGTKEIPDDLMIREFPKL